MIASKPEVIVVGIGIAGLVAGLAAARRGARTLVVAKGFGTTHFRSGCLDVLGYSGDRLVAAPAAEMPAFLETAPVHPYRVCGDALVQALQLVRESAAAAGLEMAGGMGANQLVATATGTLRPSCLVPASMSMPWDGSRTLVVGLRGYKDFHPELFAASFPQAAGALGLEVSARAVSVDLPSLRRRHLDGLELARLLDQVGFRKELVGGLRPHLNGSDVVALPAVLGLENSAETLRDLSAQLEMRVVEVPTLPPSVPGIRLQRALEAAIRRHGGETQIGTHARAIRERGRAQWLELDTPGHPLRIAVNRLILASGGLASGGLRVGPEGEVVESVADLTVALPEAGLDDWFGRAFFDPGGQPAARMGVRVDASLRPLDAGDQPALENVFACGGILAGADRPSEKSADGIACASGLRAGEAAAA